MADSQNSASKVPSIQASTPGSLKRAPDLKQEPRRSKRKRRVGFWLLMGSLVLIGLSLSSLLQPRRENSTTSSIPSISAGDNLLNSDRSLADVEREANRLIDEGRPKDALTLLQGVPGAEQKREQTIGVLMERANQAYPERLELAIYILENVPSNSPQYNTAQEYLQTWRTQYDQLEAARFALRNGDVAEAARQLEGLKGTEVEGTSAYQGIQQSIQSNTAKPRGQ